MSTVPMESSPEALRRRLPFPIAWAWNTLSTGVHPDERTRDAIAAAETALRTLAAVLLADYRCRASEERIERLLAEMERPSLGHWEILIRELIQAARGAGGGLLTESVQWYDGVRSAVAGREIIQLVVQLRNRSVHPPSHVRSADQYETSKKLVDGVTVLLRSLEWLASYRLVRVTDATPETIGAFRGHLQSFVGLDVEPRNDETRWAGWLRAEEMYLITPTRDRALELSPWISIPPRSRLGTDLFLLRSLKRGELHLGSIDGRNERRASDVPAGSSDRCVQVRLIAGVPSLPFASVQGGLAGRYQVRDVLGVGGMGTVYRVFDTIRREEVALKTLDSAMATDEVLRTRFEREAGTLRRLGEAGVASIVPVRDFSLLEDGRPFFTMPLYERGSLEDRIRPGAMSVEEVAPFAQELLEGLVVLHAEGVLHRDIKPSNILIDDRGRCRYGDFGVAMDRIDFRLTRTLDQLGSLPYLAPELLQGDAASPASDVFALAIVLDELLTGTRHTAAPGKTVKGWLGELIRKMGVSDPEIRITAKEALDLARREARSSGGAAHAGPDPEPPPKRKPRSTPGKSKSIVQ